MLGHAFTSWSRSSRRRILPDGLFGSDSTKRYSRGRLKRASGRRRGSGRRAPPPWPSRRRRRRRAAPAGRPARRRPPPRARRDARASTSSTSSGWTFSPPETIMSSTRPSIQRSPSSSRWPCRRCGTSRRGSPSRPRRGGSSSRRRPRRSERSHARSRPGRRAREPRVDRRPAGAAGLAALVAPDRERVDLGRAVVVDEHLRPEHVEAAPDERRRHRRARVAERAHGREVAPLELGWWTRSWKSVGAR